MNRHELGIRTSRLRQQGYRSYEDYIASSAWRSTRARYWQSDRPKSCICGASDELVLHHKTYERLGAEWLTDLQPLCKSCHPMIHDLARRGDIALDGAQSLISATRSRKAERVEREARLAAERAEMPEAVVKASKQRSKMLRVTLERAIDAGIDITEDLAAIDKVIASMKRSAAAA